MKERIYLPNLNGIRFFAAFMVIISHLELNKSYFNLANNFQIVKHLGVLGVTLFFVLSGFLITYLLIKEKEKETKINIKNFYLRRVFRIWPLYYLIGALSIFVFPHIELLNMPNLKLEFDYNNQIFLVIFLFIFLLSNLLVSIKVIPFAAQTWSIGTEEQFYLFWPILINKVKNSKYWFVAIIILYNLLIFSIKMPFFENIKYIGLIKNYIFSFQLDSLTVGALGAYWFHKKSVVLKYITNNYFGFIAFCGMIVSIMFDIHFRFFNSTIYAFLFLNIILNLVANKSLTQLLENKALNYLGKISYGLYMYHQILIVISINLLLKWNVFNNLNLFLMSVTMTILVSSLSFEFFEKPFLNKKEKFSVFRSLK